MIPDKALARFPFALPPHFAERLGYRGDRRLAAAHWEPLGDEITVRDDRSVTTGCGDRYVWSDFFHRPVVRSWLALHNVNLGNSDEAATHWLIIDRAGHQGFVAPVDQAWKHLRQQRLRNLE
jgi:hypothetical protein